MLKFELRPIRLERLDRYYLPLPKLTRAQLAAVGERLELKGYSVKNNGEVIRATDAARTLTVARSGLAWSGLDMLDALAPAVPKLLSFPREPTSTNPYFAAKKIPRGFEVQFFPRMESLRLWSELRRTEQCGLTPDEKAVIKHVLSGAVERLRCVTDYPADASSVVQIGRMQYYDSLVSVDEFCSRLRTITGKFSKNCYLPRASVIRMRSRSIHAFSMGADLGEWCYLQNGPKASNS